MDYRIFNERKWSFLRVRIRWAHRHRVSTPFLTRGEKITFFIVLLTGFEPSCHGKHWTLRPTLYQLSHPVTPSRGSNIQTEKPNSAATLKVVQGHQSWYERVMHCDWLLILKEFAQINTREKKEEDANMEVSTVEAGNASIISHK